MAESTSTLQAKLKALTHGKVDIMLDADTFKSTTQILREMAGAWEYMTDIERAAALELMGGKRQANILASVIKNFDTVEKVINTSMNSEGSALAENEKYLNSIQGKMDQLSNSTQTMWMNFMNSDVLKFLIDMARGAVELANGLGLVNTAIGLFVAKTAFQSDSFGKFFDADKVSQSVQDWIDGFKNIKNTATDAANGIAVVTNAQSVEAGAATGTAAANAANSASQTAVGTTATIASFGVNLLNAALAMLISMGIGLAITGIIKGFDMLRKNAEETAQAAEEAIKSYQSTQETLNKQKAVIDELAVSYKVLSKGVNLDTNENINLPTSSYQKYLDVCNDIADMYPNLVTGFDAQGNAILSLKGNVDALTESYKEAAQANRQKLIAGRDDIFSTFKNDYDNNAGIFDDTTGLKQQLAIAKEFQEAINSGNKDTMQKVYDNYFGEHNFSEDASNMFEAAGLDAAKIAPFEWFKGRVVDEEQFKQASSVLNAFITSTESKIKTAANNVKTLMGAYLDENWDYAKLDDNAKSVVSTIISNLDAEFVNGFESADDLWTWIDTNFIDAFEKNDLGQQISKELSDAFNFKAQLKNGEMPLDEYRTEILSFVDFVKNSGLKEEAQEQILQMFDIDLDKEDSIGAEIDEMLNYVNGIVDEKTKGKVMQLSYSDLQIINSDQFKVPEGTLLTWDQLQAKIKKARIAATQDFTSDNFADYAESVSAISGSISTYHEALEKLESGTFTLTDFMELIAQFPDLADGVDMSSKSFNGLSKNLRKAIRNSPDDLVDELEDLRDQLVEAEKSTDHIDALINSIENMPESAVKDLGEEYITLADQVDDAKRAVNELKEAMSENPNEGFETRGDAIEQMKTLMEGGQIGSESELWSIAEAFGFTYDSAKTINENADALYKFITAREKWYATDDDGNYTYEGTETAIEAIEKAAQSQKFKDALKKQGLDPSDFEWDYEDGKFDFDFDNENWDEIVSALSATKEAAGLTSEEFYDLLMQIGQFHEIEWEDPNDVLDYLNAIAEGTAEPTEKLKEYGEAMQEAFGKDSEIDLTNRPHISGSVMQEAGWTEVPEDDVSTVYTGSRSNESGTVAIVTTPILPDGKVLSPEKWQEYTDGILESADPSTYTFEYDDEKYTGDDIFLAKFEGDDAIDKAGEYSDALHIAQEQYDELRDPLKLEATISNKGLKGLNEIADLQGTINTNSEGTTVIDTDAFSSVLKEAGYTEDQINTLIAKIKEYENVVAVTNNDPLGLNNTEASLDSVISSLDYFGIEWETTKANIEGNPVSIDINATDLITKLQEKGWTREQIIAYLQTLSSEENGLGITINGQVNMSTDQIDTAIEKANEVPEKETTEYTVTGTGQDAAHDIKDTWSDVPKTKTTTYNVNTTETTTKRTIFAGSNGGHYPMANGTAHAQGTGSWGAPETTESLVGELGPELRVRGNEWTLIGQNGAEFTDVRKGDIIFNHKQTEDLLKNGYVTGRGKAYASGTAFASGNSSYKKYTFYDTSNSSSKKSKAAKDATKETADDFKEIFDWIEVRLEEITEAIDLSTAKLDNAIGYAKKNNIIDEIIDLNQMLYDNLTAGASEYYAFAEELLKKVPEQYREMAKDGSIAIESFTGKVGDETLDAINDYREWVQKGADATQQAEETLTEISSLAKQAIDNIAADYENKRSLRDNKIDQYEAYNSLLETDIGYESTKIYQAMMAENNKNIEILSEQRNKMLAELNKRVESGEIKKNSQDWYDAVNDIAAVDTEIIELKTDVEDYQDAINELHWEHFDNFISQLEAVSDEAENLIDILGNEDVVDEVGNWTKEGITSLGLYVQQMENAEMQAKQYREEISYLNKNWKKLGYTEQEYIEKLEELKSGQYDAIKAYEDTKEAIVDLNSERIDAIKEGIEKEIESYEKLIQTKKEELSAEKDLYDFQKSVQESSKDIAEIERKLTAISTDNSSSARAERARLQAELAEAKQNLEDQYYDRSVSNQQEALDKELETFQEEKEAEMEALDEYLENTEQVVADSLATVEANTAIVYETLKQMGSEYGLSITEALTSPWKEGEYAIQSFSEKFGITMSATVEELQALAAEWKETMAEIEASGSSAVSTVNSSATNYQASTYTAPTTSGGGSSGGSSSNSGGSSSSSGSGETYPYGKASETTGNIKKGNRGKAVKAIQYALNQLGYGNSGTKKVDGIFGSGTQSAVKKFQKAMGISADGIVGKNTRAKFKLKGYKTGVANVPNDQLAIVDEDQLEELVLGVENGRLTYLSKGSSVIPADLTSNLMSWGTINPQDMLDRNRPSIGVSPSVVNNTMEFHIDASVGELMHVEELNGDNPDEVLKIVNKALEQHTKNLNNALRKFTR